MFGLGQEKEWMRGGRRREGWRRMIWRWCEFDKAGQLRATPLTQTVSPCVWEERSGADRYGRVSVGAARNFSLRCGSSVCD